MSPRKSLVSMLVVTSICAAWCTSAPAQPVLTIDGTCPGPMRAEVRGALPESGVALLFSPRTGSFRIPWYHWCEGALLGLSPRGLRIIASAGTDEYGYAFFEGTAAPGACGGYLQTLSYPSGNCEVSNVVRVP